MSACHSCAAPLTSATAKDDGLCSACRAGQRAAAGLRSAVVLPPSSIDTDCLLGQSHEVLRARVVELERQLAALLPVYASSDQLGDCIAEFPDDPWVWSEYVDALMAAVEKARAVMDRSP